MLFRKRKDEKPKKRGVFAGLKQGLQRTRDNMLGGMASLVLGKKIIDADLLETIETQLLLADVGVATTKEIIDRLTAQVRRKELADPAALMQKLQQYLTETLQPCEKPLIIDTAHKPYVILMIGVNGAGKTTTIGKLANKLQAEGHKVMLAAGDTFRAAAIEQLQVWGQRNDVAVIAQQPGADSAAVIYDAIEAAKARDVDVLIADTAGRLHTQSNLMEELKKVKKVLSKTDNSAPHEVMLVLDAGIGQNAIAQAKQFNESIGVTGITLTKLDGTAKGGIIFAIAQDMSIPIRFIGVGERIEDLQVFNAAEFVKALFAME